MPKKRTLNIELRGFILQHTIRQEYLTSEILKAILRILKNKTKTLGNTSSSLSFKNKVDLLHDLGDIADEDYKHFEKLLEIRNQFAHNSNCNSFIKLREEKPDYTKYILSKFNNTETDDEKRMLASYILLFKRCHKILIEIKRSYNHGLLIDLERFQSYEVLNNKFWDWTNQAKEDFEKSWTEYNLNNNEMMEPFKLTFFIATLDAFKYKLFSEIAYDVSEGKRYEEVFNKKMNDSELENRNFIAKLNMNK